MNRLHTLLRVVTLCGFTVIAHAQIPKCSTEKVNRTCYVNIDRRFPIVMPTFPMHPHAHIIVDLYNPFHFETVTLDPTTLTALQGTDQAAGLITSATPDLKGFQARTSLTTQLSIDRRLNLDLQGVVSTDESTVQKEANALKDALKGVSDAADKAIQDTADQVAIVYLQLKEIQLAVPRPVDHDTVNEKRLPGVPTWTPRPWSVQGYTNWRDVLLAELSGSPFDVKRLTPTPVATEKPSNVIGAVSDIVDQLPSTGNDGKIMPPNNTTLFDLDTLRRSVTNLQEDVANLPDTSAHKKELAEKANRLATWESHLETTLATNNIFFGKVRSDLQSYYWNISRWKGETNQTGIPVASNGSDQPLSLGDIPDPRQSDLKLAPYKALGRQITYAINVENQIGTSTLAVPTNSQKTAIVTITALYADPRFEVSSGAFFSSLPNRTFSNYTTETISANGTPVPTDIRISQSLGRPEILPFVAANYRIGREWSWLGQRRGAAYGTVAVALNPYNSLPEFAGGFSVSWRSIMLSPLYHLGHGVHLTQGEQVGQIYCVYGSKVTDPPACAGSPPSPTTKTYWTNAFALGISVRIPTLFNATNH